MTMSIGASIGKWNDHVVNEDAILVTDRCIAVSDGAGGSGLFANEWSQYLIEHLPQDTPITTFQQLDEWIDGIWEPFYNKYEEKAKEGDGMLLSKFYNEGSYATLAAVWWIEPQKCIWMTYGDSVVFHFNKQTARLTHSFTRLPDFSNPPHLLSCKDPLEEIGFRNGTFTVDENSIVFVASDALSHYILMMYELSMKNNFDQELQEERTSGTLNAQLLFMAESIEFSFRDDVLIPLLDAVQSHDGFESHLKKLYHQGVLDMDDFSLVVHRLDIKTTQDMPNQ